MYFFFFKCYWILWSSYKWGTDGVLGTQPRGILKWVEDFSILQFGRGDVDTHSGKPVYTSELQSKSSCDLAVVFTSFKYMHWRSTWKNFSRRWLSFSDQHWSTLSFRSNMWWILWCQTSVSYCIGYHLLVFKLGYVQVGKLWPNLALEKKGGNVPSYIELICLFKSPVFGFTTVALC